MFDLIVQYKNAKKKAGQIKIDPSNPYIEEEPVIAGMVSDLDYAIEWMRTGKQPNAVTRGVTTKSAYARRILLNTNIFPCLDLEVEDEKPLSDYKKRIVRLVLGELTERQLTCFLLHVAHMRTHQEIAEELHLKATTVQNHIERAREKIDEVLREHQFEL